MKKFTREYYKEFVKASHDMNGDDLDEMALSRITDILNYFGPESYMPLTRLLLSNWKGIQARIDSYAASDWLDAERTATETGLEAYAVAALTELFEGDDMPGQDTAGKRLTKEELEEIRKRVAEAEATARRN